MVDANTENAQSVALSVLGSYGISIKMLARIEGVGYRTALRAMDPDQFPTVRHGDVVRLRRRAERMLRAAGWEGDSETLWQDYEQKLSQAA